MILGARRIVRGFAVLQIRGRLRSWESLRAREGWELTGETEWEGVEFQVQIPRG